jgi:hypothetical protein
MKVNGSEALRRAATNVISIAQERTEMTLVPPGRFASTQPPLTFVRAPEGVYEGSTPSSRSVCSTSLNAPLPAGMPA